MKALFRPATLHMALHDNNVTISFDRVTALKGILEIY